MKCRFKLIVVTIVFLVLMLYATNAMYEIDVKDLFMVSVHKDANPVLITPWMGSDSHVYVMLPSYADLSSTKILVAENVDFSIEGKESDQEINCGIYQLNVSYKATYKRLGKDVDILLTFLQSANISTIYIDTESGNMDFVHAKKRNAEAGTIRLYQASGTLQYDGTIKSIAGRGNTTWDNYEKKSYTIDLGENGDLLGMGAARDWILLSNAADPSHVRNKMVFDFAKQAGLLYSPESDWVDLYLNGEYTGLYLLSEQNEVHIERIAIENQDSFLVTMEGRGRMVSQNLPYIETDLKQVLRVRYPKAPTDEQLQKLNLFWNDIEHAIVEDNECNTEWTALIDLDSWVKKYLIEEIFGSLDACYKSQYFYYDGNNENTRVMAGPVWDFDLSMGRTWHTESLDFLWANRLHVDDQYDTPWFHELYKKEAFFSRLKEIFLKEMLPLLQILREKQVQEYRDMIAQAAKMNQIRWQMESFDDEVELILDYLTRRIDFLTSLWVEGCLYHLIEARSEGSSYAYFAVRDGERIPYLPVLESSNTREFEGWYTEGGMPFDETEVILEDIRIYAKWHGASTKLVQYVQYLVPLVVIVFIGVLLIGVDVLQTKKVNTADEIV